MGKVEASCLTFCTLSIFLALLASTPLHAAFNRLRASYECLVENSLVDMIDPMIYAHPFTPVYWGTYGHRDFMGMYFERAFRSKVHDSKQDTTPGGSNRQVGNSSGHAEPRSGAFTRK